MLIIQSWVLLNVLSRTEHHLKEVSEGSAKGKTSLGRKVSRFQKLVLVIEFQVEVSMARQELVTIYNWASCWNNQWSYLWNTSLCGVTVKTVCLWSYQLSCGSE